jgi:hypothetical protein
MSIQNNVSDSALVSDHQRGSPSMNTHDDDLRVRLGRIRNRGSYYKGFFAEVRSAARNEGYRSRSPRDSRHTRSYFWPRTPGCWQLNLSVSRHCLRSNRISFLRKSTTQYYETKKMIATFAATTFVYSTSLVPISQATFPMSDRR